MNKVNKQRFTDLYLKDKLQRYPSFIGREYAVPAPKLKETGANDLTRLVIDFLTLNNCQAERITSQGQYRDNTKQVTDVIGRVRTIGSGTWTKGTSTAGTADISATIKGRSVKIEIKWAKDIQSTAQKQYQNAIEKSMGIYIIVKTFDDFVLWFDNYLLDL
jgi:hypothetical protein